MNKNTGMGIMNIKSIIVAVVILIFSTAGNSTIVNTGTSTPGVYEFTWEGVFSVQDGVAFPPSLRNIFKEYCDDLQLPMPANGNLIKWAKHGVDFLRKYCFDSDGRMFYMVTQDGRPLRKRRYKSAASPWRRFRDII